MANYYENSKTGEIPGEPEEMPNDIWFTLPSRKKRRITEKQARQWDEKFEAIDVFKKLQDMSSRNEHQQFVKENYYWQIHGILQKTNKQLREQE